MSGRRKTDKQLPRLAMLLAVLVCASNLLAAVIGYRALRLSGTALETLDTYNAALRDILRRRNPSPQREF